MTSQPNPPTPITIEVKIKPNAEVITPLELGSIKYQYPKVNGDYFVSDQISEIVVLDSPIGYTRFAAMYGAEASVNVTRAASAYKNNFANEAVSGGALNYSTSLPISSLGLNYIDPDIAAFSPELGLFNGYQTLNGFVDTQGPSLLGDVDTPRWSLRDSSAYYPQLDFFPRYNQWFASTVWSTPYDPGKLIAPKSYDIMFVYVDRLTKKVYYRNGKVVFSPPVTSLKGVQILNVSYLLSTFPVRVIITVDWVTDQPTMAEYEFVIRYNSVGAPEGEQEGTIKTETFAAGSKRTTISLVNDNNVTTTTAYDIFVAAVVAEIAIIGRVNGEQFSRTPYVRLK